MKGTERFEWSMHTRPLVENLLLNALPQICALEWTEDFEDKIHLDRQHGIDLICRLKHGQPLTMQVKVLNSNYSTVTIESVSSYDGSPGDWASCLAQYIFVAYSTNGESVERWALIDLPRLNLAEYTRKLSWGRNENKVSGSSKFRWIAFDHIAELVPECIVLWAGDWDLDRETSAGIYNRRVL